MKEKKKVGRPERDFEKKTFENLCFVQSPKNEMEFILHTDHRVINKWCLRTYEADFDLCYKRFGAGGKASLRRDQFRMARNNASMAIWLGKQYLGQKDHPYELEEFNGKLGEVLDHFRGAKIVENKGELTYEPAVLPIQEKKAIIKDEGKLTSISWANDREGKEK